VAVTLFVCILFVNLGEWPHLGHIVGANCGEKNKIVIKRNVLCGFANNVLCKRGPLTKLSVRKADFIDIYFIDLSYHSGDDFCVAWRDGLSLSVDD
jgi:hypothetical protein